jgi:hypothetical protein
MSVSGSGVSAGSGGGNIDLQAIIEGGTGFTDRLKLFDQRAAAARENAQRAEALIAQAARAQLAADQTQARADGLIAENVAKGAELDAAIAAAQQARAELDARLAPLLAILRA